MINQFITTKTTETFILGLKRKELDSTDRTKQI